MYSFCINFVILMKGTYNRKRISNKVTSKNNKSSKNNNKSIISLKSIDFIKY